MNDNENKNKQFYGVLKDIAIKHDNENKNKQLYDLLKDIAIKQDQARELKKEISSLYKTARQEITITPGENSNIDLNDVRAKVTFTKSVSFDPSKVFEIYNGPNQDVANKLKDLLTAKVSYTCSDMPALLKAIELDGNMHDAVEWCMTTKFSAAQIAAELISSEEEI